MIDAYTIGVSLNLTGDLNKVLGNIIKQFETLDRAAKQVQGSLTNIAAGMERAADAAERVARAWKSAAESMGRASAGGAGNGSGGGGGFSGGTGGGFMPPMLPGARGNAALAAPAAGLLLAGPGGGGGRPPANGGFGSGGGLPPWPGSKPSKAVGNGYGLASHDLALAAAGYGMVGYGIWDAQNVSLDAAAEVDNLRHRLLAQGVSKTEADATIAAARNIARDTPGLTTAQVAGAAVDLKNVLGGTAADPTSMGPAMTALPAFAQTMSVLNAMGKANGDPVFALAKAQELLGHLVDEKTGGVSSEALQKQLDMATRVSIATNNRVDPAAFLSFAKQARVSGLSLSDDALYGYEPALLMSMGGSRAGTGQAAMFRQFSAGTMTAAKFGQAQKLGLFDASADWQHGQVKDASKHLKDYDEFVSNPVKWIYDVVIPALAKSGITDRLGQARAVASFASTATGGGFIAEAIANQPSIEKERANINSAQTGNAALNTLYDNNYTLQLDRFHASLHNFLVDIGTPLLKTASDALDVLVTVFNKLGEWANKYPNLTARLQEVAGGFALFAIGTAALSGIMLVASPMVRLAGAVANFASGGAAAAGLTGLTAGISTLLGVLARASAAGFAGYTVGGLLSDKFDGGGKDAHPVVDPVVKGIIRYFNLDGSGSLPEAARGAGNAPPGNFGPRRDRDGPVSVTIANPRDLARALNDRGAKAASQMTPGVTSVDPRIDMSAGMLGIAQ